MFDVNLSPDRSELRQFGFIGLTVFTVLGAFVYWRGGAFGLDFGAAAKPVAIGVWAVGATWGILAALRPEANRPSYVLLTVITYPIGFAISMVLLAVFFFGILTPLAILFRFTGRDVLGRKFDRAAQTYWSPRPSASDLRRYYRQY